MSQDKAKAIKLHLTGITYQIDYNLIKSYMEKVDFDRTTNVCTCNIILPVIRKVLTCIVTSDKFQIFTREPELKAKVLAKVDVNEISDKLDSLIDNMLPTVNRYLPNIDPVPELAMLFASNYVHTLILNTKLPKYVRLGTTTLRLRGKEYWRDGGQWGVNYKLVNDNLVSWSPDEHEQLHNVKLIEITEEEYISDNKGYYPYFESRH